MQGRGTREWSLESSPRGVADEALLAGLDVRILERFDPLDTYVALLDSSQPLTSDHAQWPPPDSRICHVAGTSCTLGMRSTCHRG